MYKIGIIGDRSTVAGFIALGYSVYEAEDVESARAALKRLADPNGERGGTYAIIFIVEKYARELREDIKKYSGQIMPAIVVLPDGGDASDGTMSYGMSLIKEHVERAVGADILFRE